MFGIGDVVEVLDKYGNEQNVKGTIEYIGDDDVISVKCVRADGTIYSYTCYTEDLKLIFDNIM